MTPQELFTEIRQFCEINSDPAVVQKYSRYFKEGFDAYGITFEKLRCKTKSLIGDKSVNMNLIIETSKLLLPTGKYEETSFAIGLMREYRDGFTPDTFRVFDNWFDIGMINWGHTDVCCGDLIGSLIERNLIGMDAFSDWRTSDRKYKRRAVPVSLLSFLPDKKDVADLLEFIDPMMTDPERVVHQGLGWFLRETWKINHGLIEEFLLKWKDDAARLIFQYATEKMSKEERLRFRREKK
jgi:3-methyladenine DNA glycosylase AlkD